FATHDAWVEAAVAFAAAHPVLQLVVRVHPNSGGPRAFGSNMQELAFYDSLRQRLPTNVRLIASDEVLNSYTLAGIADVSLVWHSTIGIEMAALGRPVVRAGGGWLAGKSFLLSAASPATYAALLEDLLRNGADDDDAHTIGAWRFAYLYFV